MFKGVLCEQEVQKMQQQEEVRETIQIELNADGLRRLDRIKDWISEGSTQPVDRHGAILSALLVAEHVIDIEEGVEDT